MRIIITAAKITRHICHVSKSCAATLKRKVSSNVMRVIPVFLCIAALALPLTACGEELENPPTATTAPTIPPTATQAPVNTSTAVPTQAMPTSTTEPEPAAKVEDDEPEPQPIEVPPAKMAPERDLDIVTLLPPDAIPAIDNPTFFETAEEADEFYGDDEYVLGVEIDGDARAYSVPLLSSHEIVNDTVGGRPIAVTW